ncbi:MAG: PAS domain-containing protein [Calditrichaeota bacterium]|nr:PAS domain-containing protein [Calditrichota bacterium]
MNISKHIFKSVKTIRPVYLILVAAVLFLVLFGSAYIELRGTRQEIFHVMKEEASTLIASLEIGGKNSLVAYSQIEWLQTERLLAVARHIRDLEAQNTFSPQKIKQIVLHSEVYNVHLFDRHGKRIFSYRTARQDQSAGERLGNLPLLRAVLTGKKQEMVVGFRQSSAGMGNRYAVAVHRPGGGAVVVSIDAAEMLALRKQLGIGQVLQEVARAPGIVYIVLQDSIGILAASKNITEMSRIDSDPFLKATLRHNRFDARVTTFNGERVLEVVKPFMVNGELFGLFRVGLKMTHIVAANQRLRRRFLLLSLALFVLGIILFNFLIINQNYAVLNRSFKEVKTYTGNILENMADAVLVTNASGKVTLFNRAAEKLFALSEKTVLGRPIYQLNLPCIAELKAFMDSDLPRDDKEIACQLNGESRILSARLNRLISEENGTQTIIAIFRDVSRQRLVEERLKRQEKLTAMGELAAGVAHEIRNPLNAIGMIAQRFAREFVPKDDAEDYQKLTRVIISEIRRVNQIIQQFLQFARPPELNRQPASVDAILRESLSVLNESAKAKGVQIETHLAASVSLRVDRNQLKQAFLNLIQNALEATPAGGKIWIHSSKKPDGVKISIGDTGAGIPREKLQKIFNLYFTTKPNGTGLGLSMVHQIVSAHNGHIEVQSEEGKGTVFEIILPIEEA